MSRTTFTPLRLARLVVVLGVLIGLALMQGSGCRADIPGYGSTAPCPVSAVYDLSDTADSPHDTPGGVLGACLTVLVTLLGAVLLTSRGPGSTAILIGPAPSRRGSPAPAARIPDQASLCVLRT
ncbi:hypothetical protein [Amycolatopsis suaedae]|uniref:Uncharacterized protein n=1 Tax=Amycolatopsis suaedae TaxID=2510978 RepID=A0A4Q7J6C8_9PSEU|nr:hypothetical protein [Amycolatopsis suaedae]RZQ62376.1 hypothetical protein EWH70_19090 [Amycolatopsis suaedae]